MGLFLSICREIKEVRKGKQSKEFEKYSEDFRNVEVRLFTQKLG